MHERIAGQLNDIIQSTRVPAWMTKGRTVLIPKDPTEGNIPSNFRPITCLPLMWKLLTSMISDILYEHLQNRTCYHGNRKAVQEEEGERKNNW